MTSRATKAESLLIEGRVLASLANGPKTVGQLLRMEAGRNRDVINNACWRLKKRGLVCELGKVNTGLTSAWLWRLLEGCPLEEEGIQAPLIIPGAVITDADDAWQAYWRLPKAERRALPPPDYDPTFPRTGGIYDQGIPQPSHASRNAWRAHA